MASISRSVEGISCLFPSEVALSSPKNDKDTDGVLVDILLDQFRVQPIPAFLAHVEDTSFDFEIPSKLLECYQRVSLMSTADSR